MIICKPLILNRKFNKVATPTANTASLGSSSSVTVKAVIVSLRSQEENYVSTPPKFLAMAPVGVVVGMVARAVLALRLWVGRKE